MTPRDGDLHLLLQSSLYYYNYRYYYYYYYRFIITNLCYIHIFDKRNILRASGIRENIEIFRQLFIIVKRYRNVLPLITIVVK